MILMDIMYWYIKWEKSDMQVLQVRISWRKINIIGECISIIISENITSIDNIVASIPISH